MTPRGKTSDAVWKWLGILAFVAVPWLLVYLVVGTGCDLTSEIVIKDELFRNGPNIDTVVIGDSRVMRLAEQPFADRGWTYFNLGLSGLSPEDSAMQLKYAMLFGVVKRVVMGVSFENMSQQYPFEYSVSYLERPFQEPSILEFAGYDPTSPPPPRRPRLRRRRLPVLPVEEARPKLRALLDCFEIQKLPKPFLSNGTIVYSRIEEDIRAGTYDFANRDARIEFHSDGDTAYGYLLGGKLCESSQVLYRRMFAHLRTFGISTVVFETARISNFQRLIDAHPLLSLLQREWRAFYRAESYGCVKFVSAATMADCYDEEDFFDPVHFIGDTAYRAAARLAAELAEIERVSPSRGCAVSDTVRE